MGAVRARFRAELRRRWRSLLLLSLVVGLVGGGVAALLAAAGRTESAYDRFLDRSAPSAVLIQASSGFLGPGVDLDAVSRLPQVGDVSAGVVLFTGATTPDGRQRRFGQVAGVATADGGYGRSVDRATVIEGRRADDHRVDEVMVGFDTAEKLGVHAGDTLDLVFPTGAEFDLGIIEFAAGLEAQAAGRGEGSPLDVDRVLPSSLRLSAKVVGIVAAPTEVPPIAGTLAGLVRLTPAFYDQYAAELAGAGFLAVRLAPGIGLTEFKTAVEELDGGRDALFLTSEPTQTAAVNRSLELQAIALRVIAGLVLVVALILLVQALARMTVSESDDFPVLRTLGMTRRQLFAIGMVRAAAVAVPAVLVCALVAIGLSSVFPIGLAGTIEPTPGLDVDPLVLGVASVLLLWAIPLLAAGPAWWAARGAVARPSKPGRVGRLVRFVAGSRRVAMPLGIRLALEPGRGRRAVPVRTAIAVGGVAIAAAAMTVGLGASFDHLREEPRLYGWSWDAQLGATGLPDVSGPLVAGLVANDAVEDVAAGTVVNISIDGSRVDALAVDSVRGRVEPTLLQGRAPRGAGEVALGTVTMRDLGIELGDDVTVGLGDEVLVQRVVGRAVFPNLGDAAQLGRGATMSLAALEALDGVVTKNIVLVRFVPGASPAEERSKLADAVDPYPVIGPRQPDDLVSIGNLDGLVVALGATLVVLAALTLAHTLITSVRRRSFDLALLRALGLTRRQTGAVIGWQGGTLLTVATLIGIPLGMVVARVAWRALAGDLGVPGEWVTDPLALIVIVVLTLVLGSLAAAVPAFAAARTPVARILREE